MILTIVKKEVKENLFAMKGMLWLFIVAILFSGMTYSFITVKELSLLAQTEVLVTMGKIIIGVSLLISIILASISLSNEKEQRTIESLMIAPIGNMTIILGKLIAVMIIWFMVFAVSMPYIMVLSSGTTLGIATLGFIFVIGTLVNLIFTLIATSLSVSLGSSKNSMIMSLVLFLITAIPAFLSTTMKKVGFGLIIDKLSPLSNVINLMKGTLINRQDMLSQLSLLIPLLVYVVAGYLLLVFVVEKFSFEGGE